jgi:hypothetical protein
LKKSYGKLAYAVLALMFFALLSSSLVANVHAASPWLSSNVLIVNDYYYIDPGYCYNGGGLYTGDTWPTGMTFTFTGVPFSTIAAPGPDPIAAGGYDTVVLMLPGYDSDFYNPATYSSDYFAHYWAGDFSSRITNFVDNGGKLILYDSEQGCDYSGFLYSFTVDAPGAMGAAGGTIDNPVDDTLSSDNPSDVSYIDIQTLPDETDAIGDSTVMVTQDSHWFVDMYTTNVNDVFGAVHTYAFYGAGLVIWNGLDIDYGYYDETPSNIDGEGVLEMIWWRELCGQSLTGPAPSVTGLSLTPATALNAVGTEHTVTALVTDETLAPRVGVTVDFVILSGPNEDYSGSAVTGADGIATFTWSSSADGTDTVQASIANAAGAPITATATKTWYLTPTNVIPEVPLGTAAITATMLIGLAAFYTKRRTKTPKL